MDTSKIIKGVVGNGRYTVTAPIVKEDYGLVLKIEGVDLPSSYQVDFSNSESNGTSVTMIGNADGVLIPHQFISTGKDVFAFLYHVGENFGRTVYKFRIPNKLRPDRTNEQSTPEEQSTIDQAISALNEAVEQTAQDKADADASAQNASADADRAEEARTDAQNYATQAEQARDDAQTYANNANASATASAQSASQSAQIKADVEELVDDAQASADASERSASNAYTYATSAERSSVNASASAQSASGYASQAQTSANTASTNAQDASQSATTASQKATESAQSASQALAYKTDAESAKTASQTAQGLAESARDSAISAKTDAESAKDDAVQAKEDAESAVASISGALADKADIITDTASGSIASFSDGADNLPLKSLVIDINPIQDLSNGDPSPENICPISGWTGMQLNANGTVIPISWQTEAGTVYGGKLDVLSGKLRAEWASKTTTFSESGGTVIGTYKRVSIAINPVSDVDRRHLTLCNLSGTYKNAFSEDSDHFYITTSGGTGYCFVPVGTSGELQFVYPLAEPIEIQLDAHTINSLYGQNNIFADTGGTACEYRADTKLYINCLTEPDADMIADSNITSGSYFMVGNTLYKATANIANGGQIIVGTNATRVSLAQALNEINA